MMMRCYESHHAFYHRYGARGITVTDAWHEPATFLHEIVELLGERPEGYTMDRIDNEGDYEPGNVRWATQTTQVQNRTYQPQQKLSAGAQLEMTKKRAEGATLAKLAKEYGVSLASAHRYTKGYKELET
jgi:hypothetical protein